MTAWAGGVMLGMALICTMMYGFCLISIAPALCGFIFSAIPLINQIQQETIIEEGASI
jgi:hypothetical protein